MAPDGVVQGRDVVGDTLGEFQIAELLKVGPGLIHNSNDVGVVHRGLEGDVGLLRLLHDLAQAFHRGVLRLFYFHKFRVAQEGSQRAAGTVGAGLVPHVGFHAEPAQTGGLENGNETQQAADHTGKAADQGKAAGTGLAPQQHAHHHHSGDGEGHLPGGGKVIAAGDRGGSAQGGEVPGQHRGAAVDQDKIIGRAPDSADDM